MVDSQFDEWESRAQRLVSNLYSAADELQRLVAEEREARRKWRDEHPNGEAYPDDKP